MQQQPWIVWLVRPCWRWRSKIPSVNSNNEMYEKSKAFLKFVFSLEWPTWNSKLERTLIQTELCQCHTGEHPCLYLSHKQQNNSHAHWNALSDLQMSTKLIWVSIIYELSVSTYTERIRLVKFKTQIICIIKDISYSSPSKLRYPQLSYFRSNAILNWVLKNSS